MRKLLDELYEKIRSCEVEKLKNKKEIEKIKNEIEEVSISLNSSNNLSKLEKMKQQMNLLYLQNKLELAEMKEKNSLNSELINFQEEVISKIRKIEDTIYISIRFNDLQYVNVLEKMRANKVKDIYNISEIKNYFNNNISSNNKKIDLEIMPEFKSIYEYYKKINDVENELLISINNEIKNIDEKIEKQKRIYRDSNTLTTEMYKKSISILKEEKNNLLKPRLERLQLLEELIDEMAAEVIREDMKKNNVTLSEFVKGMRYFKPEDEEKIEDFEIVD